MRRRYKDEKRKPSYDTKTRAVENMFYCFFFAFPPFFTGFSATSAWAGSVWFKNSVRKEIGERMESKQISQRKHEIFWRKKQEFVQIACTNIRREWKKRALWETSSVKGY